MAEKFRQSRIDKLKRELQSEESKVILRKKSEHRLEQALKRSKERVAVQNETLKEANKKRMQEV